jgi:hypothetical protein
MNIQEQEEADYGSGGWGDPRRCAYHGYITSDPMGHFDAPCPACEFESDYQNDMAQEPLEPNRLAGREGF